ncbi:Na+/H+ antiporter subunit E [Rossellomorea marisflavi]|uniref:Na+/H+ antiporter subunit E n=1 Tax=Rossellomorea marisflavi TaxID=189381 RepID=UPI0028532E33|nr:Na+/H+ antiporter subunit E [Rossellomorea marisflavi]MDR4937857.1 Na+/H+ antiporter subunit E [Rossellomorea marisflavi]
MPMQILINLLIGFIWMFFQESFSFLTFFSGYLFGILVLFILRRFLPHKFYLESLVAIIHLFLVFIQELFISSVQVSRHIIKPKIDVSPGVFKLETDLEGELEVTLLALLLNLTPGSVVMEVSDDNKRFYLHGINLPSAKESAYKSQKKLETAIKRVTRND